MKRMLALILLFLVALPAFAVEPDEMLSDPVLEARARAISANVRCVVCQNESIDTSNAGIARDLRILIRERLVAGDSDQQVMDFLVARYGDFVLLKPPFKPETYALWAAPFLFILAGAGGIIAIIRRVNRRAAEPETGLDPEQESRIAQIMSEESGEGRS